MQFQKQTTFSCSEKNKRTERSRKKEHRVNALALGADEGRDKLRKATFRSTYPKRRGYPNGETRRLEEPSLYGEYIAIWREPGELKHLSTRRKRKKHRFLE